MRKMRNFRTITAVTLAATMVMGSAMNVMAAASGDTSREVESSGSYEGGEMKYPNLSVTLPTVTAADYDYIADPNGLIKATEGASGDAAAYADSQFADSAQGIYFLTTAKDANNPKNIYSEKSAAKTVVNENAQDIDVTVKLQQGTTAGDADIAYAASSTFTGTDKELYLAVTDGNAKTSAISSSSTVAEVTATVEGNENNYEAKYTDANGYGYQKKDAADLEDWNDCSFYLTGALNTAATWGDNLNFPSIKVTWSYEEHTADATPSVPTTTNFTYSKADGGALSIPCDLAAAGKSAVTDFAMIAVDGVTYTVNGVWSCPSSEGNTSISGSTINVAESWLQWHTPGSYTCYVIFDNEDTTDNAITITVTE